MNQAPQPFPVSMTFYPDYRAMNPYQTQLYEGMRPFINAATGTIKEALELQERTPARQHIFHLHWEHQVLSDPSTSVGAFLNDLGRYRGAGGRVIWTLHNLTPHEKHSSEQVADLYEGLCSTVDIVQLHSLEAVTSAREHWPLPIGKIRIVPHANYSGAYPIQQRDIARKELGLEDANMIFLLPGRIAQYKSPDALIAAFLEVAGPDDRLLIAGQFGKGVAIKDDQDPRLIIREGFASADDVSAFHAAADCVVLPYARSLTSGSAILAATMGRGVLGADTPGLRDAIISPATGIMYDPDKKDALRDALAVAIADGPALWQARGHAAAKASTARDIRIVAAAWRDLISAVLASPNRQHLALPI